MIKLKKRNKMFEIPDSPNMGINPPKTGSTQYFIFKFEKNNKMEKLVCMSAEISLILKITILKIDTVLKNYT